MPGISICAVWGASALAGVAQDDTLRFAVTSLSFIDEQTKIISDLLSQGNDLLDGILSEKRRVADAPLVEKLLDAGVAFPNDPLDPTNAALTQSPIQDILSQGGLSLLSSFDAIAQNLEVLQGGAANAQPADLSQIPGTTPDNPIFIIDTSRPPVQKVEVMNTVSLLMTGPPLLPSETGVLM